MNSYKNYLLAGSGIVVLFGEFLILTLLICLVDTAAGQENRAAERKTDLIVTASASSDRVRFTSPSSVVQVHLEVYNPTGKKIFDNEVRGGNILDWHLQDGQADPMADDTYLCVVTVKTIAGKLIQRIGSVIVEKNTAVLKSADASQLSAQQTEAIGPVEEDSSWVVLKDDQRPPVTVIAHDGEHGQITRGRGALSFRIGDFFSGKDAEQMRLTEDGNLGIGITHPAVRLDVDGLIHASQGIVFPDGSIQVSAARRTLGAASVALGKSQHVQGDAGLAPDTIGTGTTGKIPKWLDGPNGVLTDSNITESSGSIGINASPDTRYRLDVNGSTRYKGSNPGFTLAGLRASGNEWLFQTVDTDGRFRVFSQDNQGGAERLTVSLNGNIGIGTATPARPLEIATGKLRFSSNLGDVEFTEVADLIAHATDDSPISSQAAFRVDTGANLTRVFTVLNDGRVGIGTATLNTTYKLQVEGGSNAGISGDSTSSNGVSGFSDTGLGVYGLSSNGAGVFGSSSSGTGVYAASFSGLAGRFAGNVQVTGTLSKGGGSFKIDHPLDPENKYLSHSFVESPDMLNIYNGLITLDEHGEAFVSLPDWFGALNRDFRYQLTCVGSFAPVYISEKIKRNRFKIAGGQPGIEVSWQVTGIRQDAYANAHRIKVEEDKPDKERGSYLHPDAFNKPDERGVEWARNPELMKQLKQQRFEAEQKQGSAPH